MDTKRRKELVSEWKNRRREMGVIAITCKATGDSFADISKDTQFAFNRHRFQLGAGMHPNKRLQALWKQYGENGFDCGVVKALRCEEAEKLDDPTDALAAMLDEYLAQTPKSERLSR